MDRTDPINAVDSGGRFLRRVGFLHFLFLSGCTASDRRDLVGNFKMEGGTFTLTLNLMADATYIQELKQSGPNEFKQCAGKWKFDAQTGDIQLEGTLLVLSNVTGSTEKELKYHSGIVLLPVSIHFDGRVRLGPDEGKQYLKE